MIIRVYSVIGILFAIFMIALDFYILKKRRMNGKSFIFWLIVGLVVGVFSAVPSLLDLLPVVFGTDVLLSSVMATGFLFFLVAIFYLQYRISEIHNQLMKLTLEISASKYLKGQDKQDKSD